MLETKYHGGISELIQVPAESFSAPTTEKWVKEPEGKPVSALPPERIEEIKVFAAKLHKKHPHMKPNRLKRKVAEYFKIKLV